LWLRRLRLRQCDLGLGRRLLLVLGRLLSLVLELERLAIALTQRIMPGLTRFDPAKDSICSASCTPSFLNKFAVRAPDAPIIRLHGAQAAGDPRSEPKVLY
jgi:hypothetical protein